MRLVALSLRQWRCYAELDLDFPDGVIGVTGANGAGKSTLAEAIGWALFGKLRAGAKVGDLRRTGAPRGSRSSVTLEFVLGDSAYRVERVVGGPASLWIDDADDPETTQTKATNARIALELDMTWETFERTVFARQRDVAALDPGGTAEARKRHVERLLGLERFRIATDKAKARTKELTIELSTLREQAPDLAALRVELTDAIQAALDDDPAVEAGNVALAEAITALSVGDQAVATEKDRAHRYDLLTRDLDHVDGDIEDLTKSLEDKRGRHAKRADQQRRLEELARGNGNLAELALQRAAWDRLKEAADALALAQQPVDFDEAGAAARADELARSRAELDGLLDQSAVDTLGLAARAEALELASGALPVPEAEARLKEAEHERDVAYERRTVLRSEIDATKQHLAEIDETGPDAACSVCLRPYGDELDGIRAAHHDRLAAAQLESERVETRVKDAAAARIAAGEARDLARRAALALERTSGPDDLDTARSALTAAESANAARAERISALRASIDQLDRAVAADRQAAADCAEARAARAAAQAAFDQRLAVVAVAAYDALIHRAAIERHDTGVASERESVQLQAMLAATVGLGDEIATLERALRLSVEKRGERNAALTALAFDAAALAQLEGDLGSLRQAERDAREALNDARIAAATRNEVVNGLRGRVDDAERAQAVIAERERDLREHEAARNLLADYRSEQNQRAWPKLEEGASALLAETTDGRYADVRLSADYKLVIYDQGEPYPLERFSGGEQDLANLCLRLAIADWVARERGVEIGFVVLDEVFGSQDETRRTALMHRLRALGNRFRQIILITHVPAIAESCEHQLDVTLTENAGSQIAVR